MISHKTRRRAKAEVHSDSLVTRPPQVIHGVDQIQSVHVVDQVHRVQSVHQVD